MHEIHNETTTIVTQDRTHNIETETITNKDP